MKEERGEWKERVGGEKRERGGVKKERWRGKRQKSGKEGRTYKITVPNRLNPKGISPNIKKEKKGKSI